MKRKGSPPRTRGALGSTRRGSVRFEPLTVERWADLENLFGPRGACAGCWCMFWRLTRSQWEKGRGNGNRGALRDLVESGSCPGILAYSGGDPIGWCAVAPREETPVLSRSRVLKPVDDTPVWSITCFFVAREHRRTGLTGRLVRGAIAHARGRGARMIEAYPLEPRTSEVPSIYGYVGFASTFRTLGFTEVARRSANRPILRKAVRGAIRVQRRS